MKSKRQYKPFTLKMKKGLVAVIFIIFAALIFLLFRIYFIIEHDSERYSRNVLAQQTYVSNPLLYKRGDIKDRNGTALAVSFKVYDLVISPKTILEGTSSKSEKTSEEQEKDEKNKEYTIQSLCSEFGLSRDTLLGDIGKKSSSQYLVIQECKGLTEEQITPFKDKMQEASEDSDSPDIVGVWFEERYARNYPLGSCGCDVIGFVSGDNGTTGIEAYYNDDLTGSYGREYGYYDSELNLQRTVKPAIDGNNIVATIDANVQQIIEKKIADLDESMGADNIAVIIMDPNNGEVLAMAHNKTFDLNDPMNLSLYFPDLDVSSLTEEEIADKRMELWRNFCIANTYEPGSTFKPFTVAAALDERSTNPGIVYTCNATMQVGGYTIGCANRIVHGAVTPKKALMQSCNCALMQIVAGLGRTQFHRYMDTYGFGKKTGIDLIGEENGIIHSEDSLNVVELATSSFGQTQNVTMMQMLSAFCSLINGGSYYQPHVVKEIQNASGSVVKENTGNVLRQTVTEETSAFIRDALKDTVKEGTATPAAVEGYDIGGKTGTAEKRPIEDRNYIVSFMGFAPTDNPKMAIYVLIDKPHVDDQAHSTYATEFAHSILEDVLPFLGVHKSDKKEIE